MRVEEGARSGVLFSHFFRQHASIGHAIGTANGGKVKRLRFVLVALVIPSLLSGPGTTAESRSLSLPDHAEAARVASPSSLFVSITADGNVAAGIVTLTIRAGKVAEHRTVTTPKRKLLLPSGATVQLSERPADPSRWTFLRWRVSSPGRAASSSTSEQLRLTVAGSLKVQARFVRSPADTPVPTSGPYTPDSTPALAATATPVTAIQPSATPTIEPICRSWHPVPRCRFPTATPVPL